MNQSKRVNTLRPIRSLPRLVYNKKKKEIKGYLDDVGSVLSLYDIYMRREKELEGLSSAAAITEQLTHNDDVRSMMIEQPSAWLWGLDKLKSNNNDDNNNDNNDNDDDDDNVWNKDDSSNNLLSGGNGILFANFKKNSNNNGDDDDDDNNDDDESDIDKRTGMGVLWTNVLDTDYSNEVYSDDDDDDNNIKETEVTEIKFTSDQDMTLQLSHIEHENYKGFSVLARMYRNSIIMMEHALNDTYYDLRTDPLKGKVKTLVRCQKCIKLLTEAIEAGITITTITITSITITSINVNINIIILSLVSMLPVINITTTITTMTIITITITTITVITIITIANENDRMSIVEYELIQMRCSNLRAFSANGLSEEFQRLKDHHEKYSNEYNRLKIEFESQPAAFISATGTRHITENAKMKECREKADVELKEYGNRLKEMQAKGCHHIIITITTTTTNTTTTNTNTNTTTTTT